MLLQVALAGFLAIPASAITIVKQESAGVGPSEGTGRPATSWLKRFIPGAPEMKVGREVPVASARETELLLRINEGLPEDLSRRLETLTAKRRAEELTTQEKDELIRLGDEVERREASRLEALSELASVRGTRLPDLMQALGLTTPSHG